MTSSRQKTERVAFERGIPAQMMAIDGSWQRDCVMQDVSDDGAKLSLGAPADEAELKEFFLLLSSTGLVYRRCELAWADGDSIGVNFLRADARRRRNLRGAD